MTDSRITRRDFLHLAGAAGLGWGIAGTTGTGIAAPAKNRAAARRRSLRVAHLTDVHIQPERGAAAGMSAVLAHVQKLDDPPALILTGGDAIMDSLASGVGRVQQLWKLWKGTLTAECSLPVEHCLGNHDVWGWDRKRSGTTGKETAWGKQRALDEFGLKRSYRSFDRGGWHFIVLDSIFPDAEFTFVGQLDDRQFDWLKRDLHAVSGNTPVAVVSHIPIVSVASVVFGLRQRRNPRLRERMMHRDAKRILELFARHSNVKLCLSGHIHLTERVEMAGVTYVSSGAVSGNWWKGNHHHTEEGYSIVDLYDDGSFENRYVPYGWKPRA